MTDPAETAMYSAWETCSECPFEDRSVWDAYWSRPGTFKLQLLKKPEQLQQIFQHFADAKSRQNQGENAKVSYRFPLIELARYFGVHVDTFKRNVLISKEYKEYCSRSAQATASPTAQQIELNGGMTPMPCSPAIIGDNSTADVEQFQQDGPEDAVADAWQLIVSDATDEVSSQIGVAGTVQDEDFVLPEGLIQALESGMKPTDMSMIHLEKSSRAVDATELQSEGSLVLGDFPDKNNETDRVALRIALREQGHYFVDGRRLAEKAANSKDLKTVMPCPLWYDLFFPYLCIADSELDSRLEQFENEISGDNDVDTDLTEVQSQPAAACGENHVEPDAPAAAATAAGEDRRRLRLRPPKQVDSPRKKLKSCSGAEQTQVATAAGFLICVYTYLASIPVVYLGHANADKCFQRIFQSFRKARNSRVTEGGDGSRSQLKAQNFPVPEQKPEETDESFYTRVAGYAVLIVYLQLSFACFAMDLDPKDYPFERHWDKFRSSALRSEAPSKQQGDHMDLNPRDSHAGVSAACNISKWAYRFSILKNSSWNMRHHRGFCTDSAHFFRFVKALKETKSLSQPQRTLLAVMMPGEPMHDKIRVAWQCHCAMLAQADGGYKKMQLLQPELRPFLWIVFDTRFVHGGGPYPPTVPRRLRLPKDLMRWFYRYGKLHFRYWRANYHISRRLPD